MKGVVRQPGIWKGAVLRTRLPAAFDHQSQDATKDQDPGKDRSEIPSREGYKGGDPGSEKGVGIQGSAAVRQ
jgi:hypothetical protein